MTDTKSIDTGGPTFPIADSAGGAPRLAGGRDAVSNKTDAQMRAAFAKKHRLRQSKGTPDWMRLLGNRGRWIQPYESWNDHGELWLRDGKLVCYTSHPYSVAAGESALADMAANFGLSVAVLPPSESWYYPGRTHLVVIWARGVTP